MTRDEHLKWAKTRALEYLPGDPQQAVTSMMSDLRKHDDWRSGGATDLLFMLGLSSASNPHDARKWIEGWN